MQLYFLEAHEDFAREVRDWLGANIPAWWREREQRDAAPVGAGNDEDFDQQREWHAQLYDAGYVGMTWPKEFGGQGRTHIENAILQEQLVKAEAPPTVNGLGIGLCGPAIIHHGTEAQQKRFLRPMLRAEEMWCQGYSEPGAGSDLANVQTRAVREGDEYVVNGQKIWTSGAHHADWCFCLCRTDTEAPKHGGIGFLLIDMRTDGVEVAPLEQMTRARGFSQVFFKDVRVPAENMVGEPTEGWRVANTVLGYERGGNTLSRYVAYERSFDQVRQLAQTTGRAADPLVRQQIAQLAIDIEVLHMFSLKSLDRLASGEKPGPEASIQKLYTSELEQRIAMLATDLQGPFGQLWMRTDRTVERGRWQQRELASRSHTIFAGTSEIQRNIISERLLGLPRR